MMMVVSCRKDSPYYHRREVFHVKYYYLAIANDLTVYRINQGELSF